MDKTFRRWGLFPAAVILFLAGLGACKGSGRDSLDLGTLNGRTYTNLYFDLSLTIPDGWYSVDQETMAALSEEGRGIIAGNDENLSAALDSSQKNTADLLMVYEYPPEAPVFFNPSLACVAEKVSHLPGIRTGRDYLLNTKRVMQMGRVRPRFPRRIEAVNLGGIDFDLLTAVITLGPAIVRQHYYAAVQKGYVLVFIITFVDEEQLSELLESLESLQFG